MDYPLKLWNIFPLASNNAISKFDIFHFYFQLAITSKKNYYSINYCELQYFFNFFITDSRFFYFISQHEKGKQITTINTRNAKINCINLRKCNWIIKVQSLVKREEGYSLQTWVYVAILQFNFSQILVFQMFRYFFNTLFFISF